MTLSDVERLTSAADEADVAFQMDEDAFRAFYDRTARALWAYLSRVTGDRQLADDLAQEAYYRFLRSGVACQSEAHRRNYLFRIATNLVRDGLRRRRTQGAYLVEQSEGPDLSAEEQVSDYSQRTDLWHAMAQLKPRERQLLWLAYAQDSTHREIAEVLGVKAASVKLLLFRARRKLAGLLRATSASDGGGRRERA